MTPVIHNKSLPLLWLDLDHWEFIRGDQAIARIGRDYWPDKWDQAALPQAHRSTFWWTNFPTSSDPGGPVKQVVFEEIECINQER